MTTTRENQIAKAMEAGKLAFSEHKSTTNYPYHADDRTGMRDHWVAGWKEAFGEHINNTQKMINTVDVDYL